MTDERIQFCECKLPVSSETAIIDLTEYEICDKCGLPIEDSGTIVDDDVVTE